MTVQEIGGRLRAVRERIAAAEQRAGRRPGSVTLLAVSKAHPVPALLEAARYGQRRFGESYLQEALPKIEALCGEGFEWHFIGVLQANKTAKVSRHFHWVHSLASESAARRLSAQRPDDAPPLQVCVQVNVDREARKAGVLLEHLPEVVRAIAPLPRLRLRGLMAIPAPRQELEEQRQPFRALREARDRLQESTGLAFDTLSMGMSDDLEAAIFEGATLVRIGTAIFGTREVP
jgi:pyridoxal phosphate enzyme (YggS family)